MFFVCHDTWRVHGSQRESREYVTSKTEFSDNRRVIRGPFPHPGFLVHIASRATVGHRFVSENKIDAQARVTAEAGSSIVPPAERFFGMLELPKDVRQAQMHQPRGALSFGRAPSTPAFTRPRPVGRFRPTMVIRKSSPPISERRV